MIWQASRPGSLVFSLLQQEASPLPPRHRCWVKPLTAQRGQLARSPGAAHHGSREPAGAQPRPPPLRPVAPAAPAHVPTPAGTMPTHPMLGISAPAARLQGPGTESPAGSTELPPSRPVFRARGSQPGSAPAHAAVCFLGLSVWCSRPLSMGEAPRHPQVTLVGAHLIAPQGAAALRGLLEPRHHCALGMRTTALMGTETHEQVVSHPRAKQP